MKTYLVLSVVFIVVSIIKSESIYDITKFGADVKGINKSSDAIKKAMETATKSGGGTIFFPNGIYLCGPIHLKSNITLHLSDNTTIKFSKDFDDYLPMVRMRWEGTELNNFSPLIYAYKQQNITIRGKGVLDGQGIYWWQLYNQLKEEYSKTKKRENKYQKEFFKNNNLTEIASETSDMSRIDLGFLRPPFIQPFDCKDINIEDVTVKNSPFWNINPVYSENINIKGVKIEAPVPSPNTDGIDPDSCTNVYISKVSISVGDDCIAIKSGRDLQGRRIGRITENVVIADSHMFNGHSGVAIGSEMSGGVRNVTVRNCVFNGTDRGLSIKSTRGRGGLINDIKFENISFSDIKKDAILVSLSYSVNKNIKEEITPSGTPIVKNIVFKDIKGSSHNSVVMSGLPESLLDEIKLTNIQIESKNGFTLNYTKNIELMSFTQKTIKTQ